MFHGGQWLCTAFATDSKTGSTITPSQVGAAQKEQRLIIRNRIREARDAAKDQDRAAEGAESEPMHVLVSDPSVENQENGEMKTRRKAIKPKPSLLERMED